MKNIILFNYLIKTILLEHRFFLFVRKFYIVEILLNGALYESVLYESDGRNSTQFMK